MSGPSAILAIDQGTSSSRAMLFDRDGRPLAQVQREFEQHFPQSGWVEHDPEDIWRDTVAVAKQALAEAGLGAGEVASIGIANQRETTLIWDRATGQAIHKAIVWQDRRTAGICAELQEAGAGPLFSEKTGLRLDPYFSGTKLTWSFRNDAGLLRRAREGAVAAGTMDSWLVWKLTGGRSHVTDFTNASRTLLFDIDELRWDEELTEKLAVPGGILPTVLPSRAPFGVTDATVLGAEVPILGVAGDQQAAVFGHALSAKGEAKNTYGTGCFLLVHAGDERVKSATGMLGTLAAGSSEGHAEYLLEGSVFVAGAAVQWLRDELDVIDHAPDVEALANSVDDTGGVAFVPAFTGLGAPDWDPHARGAILGLTRGTKKAHIARAALEAIALSSAELLTAMVTDLGVPISTLRVDGAASENNLLMQMQADFAGVAVERPREIETTALGAAYLAGIELGLWADVDEVASLNPTVQTFEPSIGDDERAEKLAFWRGAVVRTLGWAQDA